MKRVKIAELKNRLSEHLRNVQRGAKYLVLDRERAVAQLIPVEEEPFAHDYSTHAPS